MNYEESSNLATVNMLDPVDCAAADKKSNLVDTQGHDSLMVVVELGAMTGGDADNYVTPILQESDTTADADFTTVASTDMKGSFTAVTAALANYSNEQKVSYIGTKRYVRVLLDYTISRGGAPVTALLASVLGILSHSKFTPVTTVAPTSAT